MGEKNTLVIRSGTCVQLGKSWKGCTESVKSTDGTGKSVTTWETVISKGNRTPYYGVGGDSNVRAQAGKSMVSPG